MHILLFLINLIEKVESTDILHQIYVNFLEIGFGNDLNNLL